MGVQLLERGQDAEAQKAYYVVSLKGHEEVAGNARSDCFWRILTHTDTEQLLIFVMVRIYQIRRVEDHDQKRSSYRNDRAVHCGYAICLRSTVVALVLGEAI